MCSLRRSRLTESKKSPTRPSALFLDDGGVLNDNRLRANEWLRLIAQFMPPRMGATAEQWMSANREVFPRVWASLQTRIPNFSSHRTFQRTYAIEWMNGMCAAVGVTSLPDDDAISLHTELSMFVGERAMSAIPGAAEAVRALHRAGYTLFMASGTPSWELQAILSKMEINDLFSRPYGPDLIDHVKHGVGFYQRLFEDAGVVPSSALVIESDSNCCQWAIDAGANAVWIDLNGRGDAATLEQFAPALV